MSRTASTSSLSGTLFALAAFLTWGVLPAYWKLVQTVPATQVMLHRIVWSLVFLGGLVTAQRGWDAYRAVFRDRKSLGILFLTSLLIATNWLIYIGSVNSGHIVETSLGYYINPLIHVVLGVLFLRERLRAVQVLAVLLALAGVVNSVLSLGSFPWIALSLAFTFAFYALLRKIVAVESVIGLTVETTLLAPLALGALVVMGLRGSLVLGPEWNTALLLPGAGVITALPLVWFACATRRLQLSTVGFLQYLAPSCQLLIGVYVYREPFTRDHLVTFAFIWLALAIYSADSLAALRRRRDSSP